MEIRIRSTLFVVLAFVAIKSLSQPLAYTKRTIEGVEIFDDLKNKSLFYYAPGKLRLGLDEIGKPRFQLLEMRYTGSGVYGDRGEARFLNIVQFTVVMEEIGPGVFTLIKQQLGDGSVELRPLPIRSIETILVTPAGSDNKNAFVRIGKGGSFEADGHTGSSNNVAFWTERTFTLKLPNHDAQLMWDQITQGQLSLSLAYSFHADMIPADYAEVTASANGQSLDDLTGIVEGSDTVSVPTIVRADAFPIRVDVQQWPELVKKVDLNESVPPSYPALEIRCLDFTYGLRPDLALKSVDIEASAVGGRSILLSSKKFSCSDPDLNTLQLKFPYAVKLAKPFRYRIIEWTGEGVRTESEWQSSDWWRASLDITSPLADQKFERRSLEVEVASPLDSAYTKIEVLISYSLRGKQHWLPVVFGHETALPIQIANVTYDKGSKLFYKSVWEKGDGTREESAFVEITTTDDYIYVSSSAVSDNR